MRKIWFLTLLLTVGIGQKAIADSVWDFENSGFCSPCDTPSAVSITAIGSLAYVSVSAKAYSGAYWLSSTAGVTFPSNVFASVTTSGALSVELSYFCPQDPAAQNVEIFSANTKDNFTYRIAVVSSKQVRVDYVQNGVGGQSQSTTIGASTTNGLIQGGRAYVIRAVFAGTTLRCYVNDLHAGVEAKVLNVSVPGGFYFGASGGFKEGQFGVDPDHSTWPQGTLCLLDKAVISAQVLDTDPYFASSNIRLGVNAFTVLQASDGTGYGSAYAPTTADTYYDITDGWQGQAGSDMYAGLNNFNWAWAELGTFKNIPTYPFTPGNRFANWSNSSGGGGTATIYSYVTVEFPKVFPMGSTGAGTVVILGTSGGDVLSNVLSPTAQVQMYASITNTAALLPLAHIIVDNMWAYGSPTGSDAYNLGILAAFNQAKAGGYNVTYGNIYGVVPWSAVGPDTHHFDYAHQLAIGDYYWGLFASMFAPPRGKNWLSRNIQPLPFAHAFYLRP